jgi:opacity protein-like surface antigen
MSRLLIAALVAAVFWSAAQAETAKDCAKAEMVSEDGAPILFLTIDRKTTKFEYGGSMATGSGVSQWFPINGGDTALDDGDRIEWNGKTYRRCE